MSYEIRLHTAVAQPIAVLSANVGHHEIGPFLGRALEEVPMALAAVGAAPTGPPLARYEMQGDHFDMEAGFPCDSDLELSGDVQLTGLPGGTLISTVHRGPYQDMGKAYQALQEWFVANSYHPTGAAWESYLSAPDVPEPLTEVSWPCAPNEQVVVIE